MFVVTLPASAQHDPHAFAKRAKDAGADLLEIRGDLTPDIIERPSDDLPLLLSPRGTTPPLLPTLHAGDFLDLATDVPEILTERDAPPGVTLIRSFHDHERTPSLPELRNEVERMRRGGGTAILKLALTVRSFADLRTLRELHALLPAHQERVILGMGPKAHLLRALSPRQNALTYTYLSDGEEAAPGQLPIGFYKRIAHCRNPKIFGILGGMQVLRSMSPTIHNTLFARHGIDALYSAFPVTEEDDFAAEFGQLEALGIAGLSVTAPWKTKAFAMAEKRDPLAERLQSANTLIREGKHLHLPCVQAPSVARGATQAPCSFAARRVGCPALPQRRHRCEGRLCLPGATPLREKRARERKTAGLSLTLHWKAFNTDCPGFEHGFPFLEGLRAVAIVGSGGVVPAVIEACKRRAVSAITVFARNAETRKDLERRFGIATAPLETLKQAKPDAVICAIGDDVPLPLPEAKKGAHAIDLRYGRPTAFLSAAHTLGYAVHDGLPMLLMQALEQFRLFTGKKPTEEDKQAILSMLSTSSSSS